MVLYTNDGYPANDTNEVRGKGFNQNLVEKYYFYEVFLTLLH